MPKSSRHKSHRGHKYSSRDARERSDSEDEWSSRDRRQRVEEASSASGARVPKDVEPVKRKSSSSLVPSKDKDNDKNKNAAENGDYSAEHGWKRKDIRDDCATADRWNGNEKGDGLSDKGGKEVDIGYIDAEKVDKLRISTIESKSRSTRKREGSAERSVVSSSRLESVKRRSEKEYYKRGTRDDKGRDIEHASEIEKDKERVSERDKRGHDSRHGKYDDNEIRNHGSRRGGADDRPTKKDISEFQVRDDNHNTASEKDLEKYLTNRKKSSDGYDKCHEDGKTNDKRTSARDDHIKNGGLKTEGHKDERHKDERYKDDRYRDKNYKDLDRDHRHRDSRHREEGSSRDYTSEKLEGKIVWDKDRLAESCSKKSKIHAGDSELSPRTEDHGFNSKHIRVRRTTYDEDDDHYGYKQRKANDPEEASKLGKMEYKHQGKVESSFSNNLSKSYSSQNIQYSKEHNRRGLKQTEHSNREVASDEKPRYNEDRDRISVIQERVSQQSLSSEKVKHRDRIKSDDRERRPSPENSAQADFHNNELVTMSSPFKRTANFPGTSTGHLLPQPPMRHIWNSPSNYDDDNRFRSGDRRYNHRYKKNYDHNTERGQGMIWKTGPTWPAPLPNGFVPFQHFHPPSLFGARPYMEINQAGIPYHIHELTDRFNAHGHPFGWHHPLEDSGPPIMQGWDSNNSIYGDKSQVFVRPDWDPNRHLVSGSGWEMNADMWSGQTVLPEVAEDSTAANSSMQPVLESAAPIKQCDVLPDGKFVEASIETEQGRASLHREKLNDKLRRIRAYLSRLEISADFTDPELYEEIQNILNVGSAIGGTRVTSCDESAKNRRVQILFNGSKLCSMNPTAVNAAFKRAMLVYEKQNSGKRAKTTALSSCSIDGAISPEETKLTEMTAVSDCMPKNNATENLDPKGSTPMKEGDFKISTFDAEVKPVLNSPEAYIKQQPDLLSAAVLTESPQTFEDVLPDCKVNLSRIHNPPESTH